MTADHNGYTTRVAFLEALRQAHLEEAEAQEHIHGEGSPQAQAFRSVAQRLGHQRDVEQQKEVAR